MSEEMVIRCCAPTLAAIKTGSLFSCPFGSRQEMTESLRALNLCLLCKGVASVSAFIRQMREQGLIETEPDGNLLLTDAGQQRAKLLGVRIEFFRRLLTDAGVQPELALRDAVSFSWKMSDASFDAFCAMKAEQLCKTILYT